MEKQTNDSLSAVLEVNGIRVGSDVLERKISPCQMNECRGSCCRFGALVDRQEITRISELLPRILPLLRPAAKKAIRLRDWLFASPVKEKYVTNQREYRATRVADGGCVFLVNLTSGGCALHALAEKDGVSPAVYKPKECTLFPLTDAVEGELHVHTWPGFPCTRPSAAGSAVLHALGPELTLALGSTGYATLCNEQAARQTALCTHPGKSATSSPHLPPPIPRGRPPKIL